MGRLGKLPVSFEDSVKVKLDKGQVEITGPKGALSKNFTGDIEVAIDEKEKQIAVKTKKDTIQARTMQGTMRAHLANMVKGVTEGWKKELEINGPGYRAELKGSDLSLAAGRSHPVVIKAPENTQFKVEKNIITVEGIDKEVVGQTAALVREVRKPNPYTGSGIKYTDEVVRRKAGKQAAAKAE